MSEPYDVAIIGAGIAGSSLAAQLAPHVRVLLVDRDVRGLPGATGHAPGVVGLLNANATMTELAKRSVAAYTEIEGGFSIVGGLEVAVKEEELGPLERRAAMAKEYDVPADMVTAQTVRTLAPDFVDETAGGLLFSNDGLAHARILANAFQDQASHAGAKLLNAEVTNISDPSGGVRTLSTAEGDQRAKIVVVCTGVWCAELAPELEACVAVAHPYAHSHSHPKRNYETPFIRWPAYLAYGRDHGLTDGMGSYDHDPIEVSRRTLKGMNTGYGLWHSEFDSVLDNALELLPKKTRSGFDNLLLAGADTSRDARVAGKGATADDIVNDARAAGQAYAFNGLFSVTPDGMPLVGRVGDSLYAAVGTWVTHAAGATGVLGNEILEALGKGDKEAADKDKELRKALNPLRFKDDPNAVKNALATYSDIYRKKDVSNWASKK